MTSLPELEPQYRLGLVIDLDTCVGCQACVVSCQAWHAQAEDRDVMGGDAPDPNLHGPLRKRVYSYEVGWGNKGRSVHFPKACLHCDNAVCVTVCPTGAAYKRDEDGIVLIDEETCIGCGLCALACPFGAPEMDERDGVMKKCTLCVDRLYNETLPSEARQPACVTGCPSNALHFGDLSDLESDTARLVRDRNGYDLMPSMGYGPTSQYLPPRLADDEEDETKPKKVLEPHLKGGFLGWLDRALSELP